MKIESYLERIGIDERPAVDINSLAKLQNQHLLNVPFENLDIHWEIPIELNIEKFYDKIVSNKRGGFCYELNGLFGALLAELGYEVEMISARGFNSQRGEFGPEFDHMALIVRLDRDYLVDVGFGDSFRVPIELPDGQVEDISGVYQIARSDGHYLVERERNHHGEPDWRPQYRFGLDSRGLNEFAGMCQYHQTSPNSHFTQQKICSIAKLWGRLTLSESALIRTERDNRVEERVESQAQWEALLLEHFGIKSPEL